MNAKWICLSVSMLLITAATGLAQERSRERSTYGDIFFWLPNKPNQTAQQAQIVRGKQYVSVQLHSLQLYYHSGLLENIKWLVVVSGVSLDRDRIVGDQINKT